MLEEEQIKYLDKNIKAEKDFKKFYNKKKLIDALSSVGEKFIEDLTCCFQPSEISDEIFQEWIASTREFIYFDMIGSIFPSLIPNSTSLEGILLFTAEMGDETSHDFYWLIDMKEREKLSNMEFLIHIVNDADMNDEVYVCWLSKKNVSNIHDRIDKQLAKYIKSESHNLWGRSRERTLIGEIRGATFTYQSKLLSKFPKTVKLLPSLA